MIEILYPNGTRDYREGPIEFKELQRLVGGYVECHDLVQHGGYAVQAICNEDGVINGQYPLQFNEQATRFIDGRLLGPCLGTWIILSGKDLLK